MAPKRDPVLHKCATKFADARHSAAQARKTRSEAEQLLIDKMKEKGVKHYHFDNVKVDLAEEDKINCRIEDPKANEE